MSPNYLVPDWNAPSTVKAYSTTRLGGHSIAPFNCFNLAEHVGDFPEHVNANRNQLFDDLNLPSHPIWLNQIHSNKVALVNEAPTETLSVDATITFKKNLVCAVMTADCLPILLCDRSGTQVAAIHAGWRGLASGILFETLKKMHYDHNNEIIAWLGPAIGPAVFEVDETVKLSLSAQLTAKDSLECFKPLKSKSGRYLANLYRIATSQLSSLGIQKISGAEYCTYSQPELFFSYRQSGGLTGRMASLIWLT